MKIRRHVSRGTCVAFVVCLYQAIVPRLFCFERDIVVPLLSVILPLLFAVDNKYLRRAVQLIDSFKIKSVATCIKDKKSLITAFIQVIQKLAYEGTVFIVVNRHQHLTLSLSITFKFIFIDYFF